MLMRAARLVALLTLAALLSGIAPAQAAKPVKPTSPSAGARAMWVWDRPAVRTLTDFAKTNGVGVLFVHVPATPDVGWLSELRTSTRAAGIQVQALGSETWWIDSPDAALSWQQRVVGTGLFDGIHLDIEPWLHADWGSDLQPALLGRYLHLLEVMAASPAPVELDISFWLHTVAAPGGGSLDDAVLSRVDAVTVMSYRDTATGVDSITGVGATALATAARAGKRARLAVETNDLGSSPVEAKQTFYGERRSRMASVLAAVDAAVAGSPAYAGIAVHDRRGWAAMRK